MKKIIVALMVIFLSACTLGAATTPKQKVSEFLDKYKNEHTDVMDQLKETIESAFTNEDYKTRYNTLMTNQYKSMEYKITDEVIEDDTAVVEVEVTVLNYGAAINNADTYLSEHGDEFMKNITDDKTTKNTDEDTGADIPADDNDDTTTDNTNNNDTTTDDAANNNNTTTNTDIDEDKFQDYKLSLMEKVTDTVKYKIEFTLTKNDNDEWEIDSLSDSDLEKLHGIYTE